MASSLLSFDFCGSPLNPGNSGDVGVEVMSRLARILLHNGARVLVLAYPGKFRVPKMIGLRFILHPFMASATRSRAQRLLRVDQAQR